MITLRRFGRGNSCKIIVSDTLTGDINGSNQTFSVSYEYTPGRIEIIFNGQVLTSPNDFEETGYKEIRFKYLTPVNSTILRANYELKGCWPNNTNFLDRFISLADTPTTYSGFENCYVKVNNAGDGLIFEHSNYDFGGITPVPVGVDHIDVVYSNVITNNDYSLLVSLENKNDVLPSVYPLLIKDKNLNGFTVDFSGEIDSNNYYLNWRVTVSGTVSSGNCNSTCDLYSDSSPELSNNLNVGNNLIMYNTSPSNTTVSGGFVRGYSGRASEMYISDNSAMGDGFACPLFMKADGTWGTCTAISGSNSMPCTALALDTGEGPNKLILWDGIIRKGEWSWTPGATIFVSTVDGALTDIKPNNGHWKQAVGMAIKSDTIKFDPGTFPG